MTCTETSMSGVRIGLIEIIILKVLPTILRDPHQDWPRSYGAVTGAARAGIAGAHHAASAPRTVAAAAWGFV